MLTDIGGNVLNVFVYDAFGNLIASNGVPQTGFLYSGQQWDFDLNQYYLRARTFDPPTGRFWTADGDYGNNEDPLSLHKYLYVEDNPINGIDPFGHLGLFKSDRDFGIWAHRVIEDEYQAEHPGAICGTTIGILGTGYKPDIFDGPNRVFMEIKPLSLSGVAKGSAKIVVYQLAFDALDLGYKRGSWPNGLAQSNVGPTPIVYFNVQGVIFYTDYTDNLDDMASITSFALARQFIRVYGPQMARTLIPSLARISEIVEVSRPAIVFDDTVYTPP